MSNPNNRPTQNKSSGFNPSDISFILMRHKWKIVLCTIIGLIGAAVYNLSISPDYISETKLLVRYVEEDGGPIEDGGRLATNGRTGGSVMNSEIQILTSMDLAMIVGEKIGPAKINQVGKTQLDQIIKDTLSPNEVTTEAPASNNKFEAAAMIMDGLLVTPVHDSNVLSITFQHPNPLLSQPVLAEIVETYFKSHQEAHRTNRDYEDFLTKEADQFRAKMQRTDQQIRNLYAKLNFSSIDDAKQWETSETSRLRQTILLSEAELAELQTGIERAVENQESTESAEVKPQVVENSEVLDEAIIEKHARILQRITILRNREQELLLQYTSSNSFVRGVREQISITEREKLDLIREYPKLQQVEVAMAGNGDAFNLLNAQGTIAAIKTRIRVLKDQLAGIKEEAEMVSKLTLSIEELEMKKGLYVNSYENYVKSMEEKRIDDALGESKVRNISIIQNATAPYTDRTLSNQITAGIAASGLVIGIAWAFLIELYIDRTFKRSVEVERGLGIPLFASIPNAYSRSYLRLSKTVGKESLRLTAANKAAALHSGSSSSEQSSSLISSASAVSKKETATDAEPAPWNENHALHPYFEALRDRMLGFFDSKNITHTPKMIGLTGLGEATGVSTVSGGLAGALSNMGEGNVLLVDMNIGQESAHQFYQGKAVQPKEGGEEESDSTSTQIEKNLFVVAEGTNGYKLPRIDPKRFNDLVAKLKTSDYDYIVFDLPAVSPISATPRLARSMDAVMLVIESEKSDKDVVERATAILKESNEHVGAILNKTKIYAPGQLKQDFVGHS